MKKIFYSLALLATLTACQQKQGTGNTVVLNEICGKDQDDLEWVEVANASAEPINLKGYKLTKMDGDGVDKTLYKFPDTLLAPGAIMTVNAEFLKARIPNKKPAVIEILDPDGNTVDAFDSEQDLELEGHAKGQSYARIPNITGQWALCQSATWDAPNSGQPQSEAAEEFLDDEEEEE